MDKLKPYLVQLKKHHFWVLCGVLLLAAYFAWSSGTSALQTEYEANRQQIRNQFQAAEGVRNTSPHPNNTWNDGVLEAHAKLKQETLAAWQFQYDQQQDALRWQSDIFTAPFIDEISAVERTAEIPDRLRDTYMHTAWRVIGTWRDRFHLLHTIPAAQEGGEPQTRGLVAWADYETLVPQYTWTRRPTSTQLRIAQENFWIYEALLNVINETNRLPDGEMPSSQRQAAIRNIQTLNFGQAASREITTQMGGSAPARPARGAARGSGGRGSSTARPGVLPPVNGTDNDNELLDGRYLDPNRASVSATGVQSLSQQEYRLIPVHIKVNMDQRKFPNLLAACANSPLLIEPEQIRIVANEADISAAAAAGSSGASSKPANTTYVSPYDAEVEIVGVMYMFNPPAKERLQIPGEGLPGETPVATLD